MSIDRFVLLVTVLTGLAAVGNASEPKPKTPDAPLSTGTVTLQETGDTVYIDLARAGTTSPVDTVHIDGNYEFRIWLKNTVTLGGISLGFHIWSEDGTAWTWRSVPGGWGPLGPGTGLACVTVVDGCRMDPPDNIWDMGGFTITERDMNGQSPDTIYMGGVSMFGSLPPGPLEHMISLHLKVTDPSMGSGTICIDSSFLPPIGDFLFVDYEGNSIHPIVATPRCWPVTRLCGDANGDGSANVGDAVFLISYVFKGGAAPIPLCAGDANGDGNTNVGDAVYMISYVFKGGAPPVATCCQ